MRSLLQLLALLPVALTLATSPLLKAPEPRALSAPRNNVQLQREGVKNDAARPALAKRSPREGPWANYRHLRIRDGTVPPAKYSPLPVINGDTIEKSIQTQIKSDVNAVLQEFKSLPDYVNNLLKTALSRTLNQVNLKQTPEEQLAAISKSVDDAIEKIEKTSVPTALEAISAMDQTGDIKALQACLQTIIDMGGRRSDEDGTCLSNSGATLQSLKDQFNAFVEQNTFLAPANKVNAAADEVTKYLDDQVLVPSLEYLIGNATESLRNVVLTTAAKERDATKKVFQCFIDALTMIADTPYQDRQEICVEGGGTVKGSALGDIEEAYQARINQFAGVLPPNLVTNIQQIGLATLTTNIGPYEKATRDRINTAILSAAAASSGESATIVGNLIRCLNTIYDDTPTDTCNANRDPVVLQSNANVVRNYLAQFVSTLPKVLVEALRTTVESQLHGDTGPEAESLRADLQSLFERASLGTEYESCEREFIDCTIQAMVAGTATTVCYEQRGPACQALPELSPEALDDPSNPYADIIAGLPGAGGWGGARRRAARRAANLLSGRLA